ncbi:MAG: hypothetical protein DWI29_04350 [Planctomycetota bacterium]|nr:MAG: hypothetical protein DWI29_04350 [Planctomycetota bacterium]
MGTILRAKTLRLAVEQPWMVALGWPAQGIWRTIQGSCGAATSFPLRHDVAAPQLKRFVCR